MKSYKQLWLGTLGATLFVPQMVLADISGTVFRDFNANGSLDSGAITDAGIAGVTVKAFNAAGAQVGATATSDASGHYALTGLTTGADYRVEFAWAQQWLKSSAAGGTAVQFVKDGATANFALHDPNQYAQAAPYLAIPQYINGDPAATVDISSQAGLYAFPNNAQSVGRSSQSPAPVPKAKIGQIGATWGVAYQRSTKTLYASAVLRRYSGFGPLGTGGVYKIDMSDPMAATDGVTSLNYIDLKTIGIPTGDDPREPTGCNSVAKNIGDPAHDAATWNKIGQVGIGGITMDNDNNRLWLVNLADRKLYAIQNTNPTTTPTSTDVLGGYNISLPSGHTCTDGELRPWGVTYHHGKVYVGAVCDGSGDIWNPAKLTGYVLNFDPNNAANGFGIEHSFPLNYMRAHSGGASFVTWWPWSDYSNDSPILSSLEFDIDGSLILGFANRNGFRLGSNNYYSTDCNNTDLGGIPSEGDVLRFCKSANSYLNEGDVGCSTTIPAVMQVTSGGITQKEYYWGDHGPYAGTKDNFNETAQGGLAFLPGSETLVTNGMDPTEFHQGGVFWLNNKTGDATSRYFIYDTPTQPGTMAKAAGVGDLELLANEAPIEIGNRVWLDADNDGIQDAGEGGIPNVQVKLFAGATELATATTAADGTYYFTNAAGTNTDSKKYGLDQLQPNTAYTVKFPTSVAVSGTTYNLTTATAGGNSQIDSNAAATGDVVVNATDIPAAGANNHSFDVGYSTTPTCNINTPTVTAECNNNGTPSDASDDKFTYKITATGSNVGATYSITGGDTYANRSYGTEHTSTNSFPISGGNLALTLTDDTTASCKLENVAVTAPATCSGSAPLGKLVISKSVTGGTDPQTFTIKLDCSDDTFDNNAIALTNAATHTVSGIPAGTTCTVTETTPTAPTSYTYASPIVTPSQPVTIVGGQTVAVSVINQLTQSCANPVIPTLTIGNIGFGPGVAPSKETVTLNGSHPLEESNVAGFYSSTSTEGAFYSICTEISQPILPLQNPYTHEANASTNGFNATAAQRIAQVVQASGYNSTTGFGAGNNTVTNFVALQLAVWNALYDTDYSVTAGNFQSLTENNAGVRSLANTWLAAAQTIATPNVAVHNLHNATGQDLLMVSAIPSTCPVVPKTDLKLTKTVNKSTAKTGDTLTYTLLLENESDVDATGVVVNDKLPTALTYVSHAPATASYDSATGDWTVGTLAARQKITLTIDVTVK